MASAEIIVVKSEGASEKEASQLYSKLTALGVDITRAATVRDEADAVAEEMRQVLQRRPSIVLVVGGTGERVLMGVANGADRRLVDGLPAGCSPFEAFDGVGMLVAQSFVIWVPADTGVDVWNEEVGPCLAEWVGTPAHVRGELVLLDGSSGIVDQLIASLTDQHPEVYLRVEPSPGSQGVKVAALSYLDAASGEAVVNLALSAVERAAVTSRLRVSSTGRMPAQRVEPLARAPATV